MRWRSKCHICGDFKFDCSDLLKSFLAWRVIGNGLPTFQRSQNRILRCNFSNISQYLRFKENTHWYQVYWRRIMRMIRQFTGKGVDKDGMYECVIVHPTLIGSLTFFRIVVLPELSKPRTRRRASWSVYEKWGTI